MQEKLKPNFIPQETRKRRNWPKGSRKKEIKSRTEINGREKRHRKDQ